ncbi:heterokaryon incompatibility protein domain-containing protein [Trichoderma evansii]
MFTYTPLRRDIPEIRLVRILSAGDSTCDVSLELRHASIDEINFSALSYVWGDVKNPVEILIIGSSSKIGQNLFKGLTQLFENGTHCWLWIDALCIQQSDQEEKTYQVGQMRTIFSHSERVFSWLGPGTSSTDKAMEFASHIGPRALSFGHDPLAFDIPLDELRNFFNHNKKVWKTQLLPKYDAKKLDLAMFIHDIIFCPDLHSHTPRQGQVGDDLVAGIQSLMNREYWQRIWINQEIALAREVTLLCGTKSVWLDHLEASFSVVDQCNRLHRYTNSETQNFAKGLYPNFWTNLPLETRRLVRSGGSINLSRLLYTDHLVFGLLGIITDNDTLNLRVDYQLTTAEVFTAVTRAFISNGDNDKKSYHLDHCVPREENTQNTLPSWVPDWKGIGEVGAAKPEMNRNEFFDATSNISIPILPHSKNDDSLGILRRAGCRVDIITEALEPYQQPLMKEDTQNREDWLLGVMAFLGLGPVGGPGEDYMWRTLLSQGWYDKINPFINEDVATLVRMIMRGQDIDVKTLKPIQREFLDKLEYPHVKQRNLAARLDQLEYATQMIQLLQMRGYYITRRRTLFKTMKGMLGLGHLPIKPGDVVTLLWGLPSPIILRPRNDSGCDGFSFVGDAYVDQIMHGEFLKTDPPHEVFTIY